MSFHGEIDLFKPIRFMLEYQIFTKIEIEQSSTGAIKLFRYSNQKWNIIIPGGPGSNKGEQANKLSEIHPGWVKIHLGDLLRNEVTNRGAEEKWKIVKELVHNGELAPEVSETDFILKY